MTNGERVHGSIFYLLKKFIDRTMPEGSWSRLNEMAGHKEAQYELTSNYALSDLNGMFSAASELTGIGPNELMEKFGRELVPDLMQVYANYVDPTWKTYEIILNTEEVMHGAVRRLNSTANPPILNVTKTGNDVLMIDYYSKRRLSALAVGIITGIAEFYNESDQVEVIPLSNYNDERVQIQVNFKTPH
ncbi:MAG: hypothetical protein K0S26_838 [Bacteroidota bacterium]|jgi:hypothetical protein|nr:hypothetical protein [Bacteroidota bacterium]